MRTIVLMLAAGLCLGGSASRGEEPDPLRTSLALHASFDSGFDADHSAGAKACLIRRGAELTPAAESDELRLVADGGRFGGALHFPKKGKAWPQFSGVQVLDYNDRDWNATVSVWLRLTPDEDLEPGYCDPVQIVGDDGKQGFIFLEWSKNETPRYFRYAIRPLQSIWNPTGAAWDEIPFDKRPMVQVADAGFQRDRWTHVVFTLAHVNSKEARPTGSLYLDGKLRGRIEDWDLTFGWDPSRVALVLGASYVGHLDELAVFRRALSDDEVRRLHALEGGVRTLY